MINKVGLSVAVMGLVVATSSQVWAGLDLRTSTSVLTYQNPGGVTGGGRNLENYSATFSALSLSDSATSTLASTDLTAQGGLGSTGQLRLGAYARGTADAYYLFGQDMQGAGSYNSGASAEWDDTIQIRNPGGPTPTTFFLSATLEGSVSEVGAFVYGALSVSGGGSSTIFSSGTLAFEGSLDADGFGSFSLLLIASVDANAQAAGGGEDHFAHTESTSNFLHTLTLSSVQVRDSNGTLVIPESLGYTLSFGSGMNSPDLQSVPEPTTLAGAGLAGLAGLIVPRRRKG